jgi:hypothetical protein
MALFVVITCPRPGKVSYLGPTVESLGPFDNEGVVILRDEEKRGCRWNTWRALGHGRHYDRLILLQDDVILEEGAAMQMVTMHIPRDVGIVNFHDFGDDFDWQVPPVGIHKFPAHRFGSMGMCGAQALVIPGDHACWLAEQNPDECPVAGPHKADYALGWLTARSSRPNKLIVSPSPVRHVGERSACHEEERRLAGVGIPHAGRTFEDLLKYV